jgi:predicted nucleic acid-binding protein
MIAVDINILYAVNTNRDAPPHTKAKARLKNTLSGPETVGFAWTVLPAF